MGDWIFFLIVICVCVAGYIYMKRRGKENERKAREREAYEQMKNQEAIENARKLMEESKKLFDELKFSIAGINFRKGIDKYLGMIDVCLLPDPKNEYDPDAIKVIAVDSALLGYVPRDMTEEVRNFDKFPIYASAYIELVNDEFEGRSYYVGNVTILKRKGEENNTNVIQNPNTPT